MSSPPPGGPPDQSPAGHAEGDAAASARPEFQVSLIDAMRRVVESSRDGTLAELRSVADSETGQLDARRAEREAALRERSELDINGIGLWERTEIERIRGEAVRKVAARRGQLDQELAELTASSDAERAALWERADAYEREMALFMDELAGVTDPAAFAAAAGRMPTAPLYPRGGATRGAIGVPAATSSPAAGASPTPISSPAASETQPGVASAAAAAVPETTAPETTAPPKRGSAVPTEWTAPALAERFAALNHQLGREGESAPSESEGAATAIEVHGLGSFGAITSFKQSLERVNGIRSVALALGPSGDFVYTAIHPSDFDVAAAIRTIEGEGVQIERDNGTLRVKVARGAG